jgi:mRNA-degrading endonuclease toxin of MazEF toxin-antitoxin module
VKRGDLYLVKHPSGRDPCRQRVFVVVSRRVLIDSKFATVICAPLSSAYDGLSTQVAAGIAERADRALRDAFRVALEDHERAGVPVVIWRDGQVTEVDASELRTERHESGASPRCRPE